MRILYFYLMKRAPDRVRAVAPEHAAYRRAFDLRASRLARSQTGLAG